MATTITALRATPVTIPLEAPLLHLTARWPRRGMLAGSLAAVAASCVAAACVPSYAGLLADLYDADAFCAPTQNRRCDFAPLPIGNA